MNTIFMKKKGIVMLLSLCFSANLSAQIYQNDAAIEMPLGDVYDMGAMNSYISTYREAMAIRHENWKRTMETAMEYFKKRDYITFLNLTNSLVEETHIGPFFELRGDAWSQLGYYKYALKEYKHARKLGSDDVYSKISETKRIIKEQKKKK